MFPSWTMTQKGYTRRPDASGPGSHRTRFEGYRLVAAWRRGAVVEAIKHRQCFGNAISLLGIETGWAGVEWKRNQDEAEAVSRMSEDRRV